MGDVPFAVLADKRHRDPLGAERRVALPGCRKYLAQYLADLRITGNQASANDTQDVGGGENGLTGNIGVDEPSFGIDEIHARAEPIERIGERRGFRSFELKHSSDQHGTSEMRSDQTHVPPRLLVDDAVALMAEHSEYRSAYCSPVDEQRSRNRQCPEA